MLIIKPILIVGLMLVSLAATAQQQKAKPAIKKVVHKYRGVLEASPPPQIYTHVEQAPEFIGGRAALDKYLDNAIRYPDYAREDGVTGTVKVRFMVDEDGSITNAKVVKGIGFGCDEEALRVVKAMPRWRPGKYDGKPKRVIFVLPLRFKIAQ